MKKSILTPLLGDCEYTTYAYDGWGALTNTAYSDGTPTVSVRNDALGGDGARQLPHALVRPVTGRWLSKDPIGLSGGLNLYAFCLNSPINSIGPY